MGRLRRFLAWPAAEKWLLAQAWILLASTRVSLLTLRFRRTHRILRILAQRRRQPRRRAGRAPPSAPRVGRIVQLAGGAVPGGGHCLTQALAAELLLARCGHACELTIGVAKDERDRLIAHAWVQCDSVVVIGGGPELERYTRLRARAAVDS